MVDQSPIIRSGLDALQEIASRVYEVHSLDPKVAEGLAIISNPEIPTHVKAICHLQAHAYACLFDNGHRKTESPRTTTLRIERVDAVLKTCDGIDIPELRNRGMRNAMAHFDERYLREAIAKPKAAVVQDLAFSHVDAISFQGEGMLIRVYYYDIDTVFLFNEKLRLGALKLEAERVLARFGVVKGPAGRASRAAGPQ